MIAKNSFGKHIKFNILLILFLFNISFSSLDMSCERPTCFKISPDHRVPTQIFISEYRQGWYRTSGVCSFYIDWSDRYEGKGAMQLGGTLYTNKTSGRLHRQIYFHMGSMSPQGMDGADRLYITTSWNVINGNRYDNTCTMFRWVSYQ